MTLDGTTDMLPDFVWIKNLQDAENHNLTDITRGTEEVLFANENNSEATESNGMSSFDSDGFGVSVTNGALNASGEPFIAYCWSAGGGSGCSNTTGGINTTTTSVNTTAGFSISTYTGTGSASTVGHGLGVTPKVVLVKKRSADEDWTMLNMNLSGEAEKYVVFNTTGSVQDSSTTFNDTDPTSTVFSVNTAGSTNGSSATYVAYCWADIQGFSKFGTYKGNGDADGPYIFLGFRPALLITKRTDSTGDWLMYDIKRDGFNDQNDYLKVNATTAEQADVDIDLLGNGFKIRNTSNDGNNSSGTFIYMAWAETPFVNAEGVPGTAR